MEEVELMVDLCELRSVGLRERIASLLSVGLLAARLLTATAYVHATENPQLRSMTVKDEAQIRQIRAGYLSPDGKEYLIQLDEPNPFLNSFKSSWIVVSVETGKSRYLADAGQVRLYTDSFGRKNGEMAGWQAAWSPDGSKIAFLKREENQTQLWLVSASGGQPMQLTHNEGDLIEFAWHPDNEVLTVVAGRSRTEVSERMREEGSRGILYDEYFHIDQLAAAQRPGDLSEIQPTNPGEILHPVCIVPDRSDSQNRCGTSDWIVDSNLKTERRASDSEAKEYSAIRHPAFYQEWSSQSLQLFRRAPTTQRAAWIEDAYPGKYRAGPAVPYVIVSGDMGSRARKERCPATECVSRNIRGLWWTPTTQEILFFRLEGHKDSESAFYLWKPGSRVARNILRTNNAAFSDCDVTGDELVCVSSTWTLPTHLVRVRLKDGVTTTIFDPNPEFERFKFPKIEVLKTFDERGNAALGHFIYPLNYIPGQKYPLVVVSYGFWGYIKTTGDEQAVFALSSAGFAVLYYAIPFDSESRPVEAKTDSAKFTAAEWSTSRAAALYPMLDTLIARGLVDEHRVGISGLSNGATMVDEAILNTKRFAAASAAYSNTHPIAYYLLPRFAREAERMLAGGEPFGSGAPWWIARSPGLNPDRIATPLILNVSDREVMQAVPNFASLQEAGKPIEMYVYPDEWHEKWQPAHKYNVYRRNLQWFEFWLQDKEDPDPVDPVQYARWRKLREH